MCVPGSSNRPWPYPPRRRPPSRDGGDLPKLRRKWAIKSDTHEDLTLPTAKAIKELFEERTGRDITIARAAPVRAVEVSREAIGIYTDGPLQVAGIVAMDIGLATAMAAALSLVPRAEAQTSAQSGTLSSLLVKNTVGLLESFVDLLEPGGEGSLELYQTHMPGDRLPGDVAGQIVALGRRLDADLAIAGYGHGRLSFIVPEAGRR
jgi:hypothetical protein